MPFHAYRSRTPTVYVPGEEAQPSCVNAPYTQDSQAALFVYRQRFRFPGNTEEAVRVGVLGLVERTEAAIFPHEETTPDRVSACMRMLSSPASDPGSLWMWCNDPDAVLAPLLEPTHAPAADRTDRFGCRHQIWPIADTARICEIQSALQGKTFFIADGHHRFAAGWNLATIQIRTSALRSLPSHRLVREAGPLSLPDTEPVDDIDLYLASARSGCSRFVVVLPGPVLRGFEVPHSVQVQRLLGRAKIEPIREIKQAIAAVQAGQAQIALLTPPFTVEQIETQSRNGILLPPKSTDFYPKLAAGLVVHRP